MPINSFLYPAKNVPVVYEVANSIRFNGADSPALKRNSMGTATNRKKWTLSMWVKRSTTDQRMLASFDGAASYFQFQSGGQLEVNDVPGSSFNYRLVTNAVYRDVSAWLHIVVAYDSTQGTDSNRLKLYVNGEEPTLGTATYPSQNFEPEVNSTGSHKYGSYDDSSSYAFNGYFAEIVFIDGTQYAASDFGEFDSDSPRIWKPKDISGLTFGNNGHHLDFEDSSNLGNDANGGTDFDENNITATDQSTDTCTNNFATCNSLDNFSTGGTFSEGNLQTQSTTSNRGIFTGTIGLSSGVWYWEIKTSATGGNNASDQWNYIGIAGQVGAASTDNILGSSGTNSKKSHEYALQAVNGSLYNNGASAVTYGASFTEGDILGIKLDLDNNRLYFSKNGQWADGSGNFDESNPTGYISISDPSTTESGFYFPAWGDGGVNVNKTWQLNFGGTQSFTVSSGNQDPNGYGNFEYDTKSGYAICTKNLAEFG